MSSSPEAKGQGQGQPVQAQVSREAQREKHFEVQNKEFTDLLSCFYIWVGSCILRSWCCTINLHLGW